MLQVLEYEDAKRRYGCSVGCDGSSYEHSRVRSPVKTTRYRCWSMKMLREGTAAWLVVMGLVRSTQG